MRNAGYIDNNTHARRFENYLLSLSIDCTVEEGKDRWSVWIVREEELDRAKTELAAFLTTPDDPRFNVATASRPTPLEKEKNVIYMRDRWQGASWRDAPVTMIMIAVCVLIFFANQPIEPVTTMIGNIPFSVENTIYPKLYFIPPLFMDGEYWRLITPMFGHHGLLHLLMNMYALLYLGKLVEPRMTTASYLLLTLALSVAGTALHAGMPLGGSWRMLGYSGVLFGLFGYAWIRDRFDPHARMPIAPQSVRMLAFFWLICWWPALDVANWAHTGGLLAGMAIGYLQAQNARKQRQGQAS